MKIEAARPYGEEIGIVLKEVFSGVWMEQPDGNRIAICMRDDTFEINVLPKGAKEGKWHRVDMQRVEIHEGLVHPDDKLPDLRVTDCQVGIGADRDVDDYGPELGGDL